MAIPTYNEKDNVARMMETVLGLNGNEEIKKSGAAVSLVIIDDNSPDGTRDIIKSAMEGFSGSGGYYSGKYNSKGAPPADVFLIAREKKLGLGTAYASAFRFAIEKDFDYVITMDCDFSHDPVEIINFIKSTRGKTDSGPPVPGLISGSRYKDGVRVINWSMKRLFISYFANIYARLVTGVKITDLTGGFNMYDARCLKKINLGKIKSRGYAFQIEMKFRMVKEACCGFAECPIIFYERTRGSSKMSKSIILEAFFRVIALRLGFY